MPRPWVNLTDTGNVVTLYASAARTATPTATDQSNDGFCGLHVCIYVSAVPGSAPSVVPTISGYDVVSGQYYSLLVGSAITATGMTVLKIYPGIAVLANGSASDVLPEVWKLGLAHGNANSVTYSASAQLLK